MADAQHIGGVASIDRRHAVTVTRGDSSVVLRLYAPGAWPHVTEVELDGFTAVLLVELLRTAITGQKSSLIAD